MNTNDLDWKKMNNIIPAIVQDNETLQILMLGYMNQNALNQTLETQRVTFYCRQKQRLWTKGETSGNYLALIDISTDCDQDAILIKAKPQGPTCHKNTASCFNEQTRSLWDTLYKLEKTIKERKISQPEKSYTTELFRSGIERMAQKVGEEGVEVALAAASKNPKKLCEESADLLFHLLVLLRAQDLSFSDIMKKLKERQKK